MHIMMLIGSPGCGKGTLSTHLQRQTSTCVHPHPEWYAPLKVDEAD